MAKGQKEASKFKFQAISTTGELLKVLVALKHNHVLSRPRRYCWKSALKKDHIDMFAATSLVLFSALLGLNQVMVKIVNTGMQPVFQAGLRSLCALPLVLLYCLVFKKRMSLRDGSFWPGIFCGILFAAEFILLFTALDHTTVVRSTLFFYTMPFWVAIGAHFLIPSERLNMVKIAGLVLAFLGVLVALSDQDLSAGNMAFKGDLMCLAGAVMWAGIALLARLTKLSKSSPEMQLLYQLAISAPLILFASLFFGPLIRDLQPFHLAIFSVQVVVVVSFGFAFWFWILSIYPASKMASFGFLAPVFGIFFGWLILDEQVGFSLLIALLMVATGIILVNRHSGAVGKSNSESKPSS